MKKYLNLFTISVFTTLIIACSSMSGNGITETVPKPPSNSSDDNANIMLPQIGESQQVINAKQAAQQNESQPSKFKKITDVKGAGNTVTQVNVDNPDGGLPDYYLTPRDQEVNSSSRTINPNPMSTPQWNVVNW